MSSVFHQSSDACEESVFLGRNISSLESNKRPHYYFAVERVFIAVNTNLNSGQTISECPEDHNNSLHCFTYRNLEAESKAWDYCKEASTTYMGLWTPVDLQPPTRSIQPQKWGPRLQDRKLSLLNTAGPRTMLPLGHQRCSIVKIRAIQGWVFQLCASFFYQC